MAIKNKLRNLIIILFYLTGIPYLRFLWLRRKYGPLIRIITFHEIKDNEVKAFENKLKFLKKNFNVISPKQFYNQEFSKKKLNILLTFDDGYKSWLRNVVPYLKQENLSAVLFIPSGFIEAGENNKDFYVSKKLRLTVGKRPLSWQNIKDLDREGLEIGGHTINHLNLKELSKQRVLQEISKDKQRLEQSLRHKISSFAHPFGDIQRISKEAIVSAQKTGYKFAFSTLPGFSNQTSDKFLLYRDCLNPLMPGILFKAWIYGGYDIIKNFLDIFKRAKLK